MPKCMTERNMPGAGSLSPDELTAIAEKPCLALVEIEKKDWRPDLKLCIHF